MNSSLTSLFEIAAETANPSVLRRPQSLDQRLNSFRRRRGFDASPGQQKLLKAIMNAQQGIGPREIIARTGKRAGKTTVATDVVEQEIEDNDNGMIWACSDTYEHSSKVFNAVTDNMPQKNVSRTKPPTASFGNYVGRGEANLKSKSWSDPDSLEQDGCSLIIADEAQNLTEVAYWKLQSRTLSDGGILILFGSPDADDYFFLDLWDESISDPTQATTIYWKTEDNPLREIQTYLKGQKLRLPLERYLELYEGIPATAAGVVFPQFDAEKHTGYVPFNIDLPVKLWIDPGYSNYAINAVQIVGDKVHILDEVYLHSAHDLSAIQEASEREWFPNVDDIIIDVAGKANRHEASLTTWKTWEVHTGMTPRGIYVYQEQGIKRMASFLESPQNGLPRIIYDREHCPQTIKEFSLWKKNKAGHPLDSYNHAIKADYYGLIDRFGFIDREMDSQKIEVSSYLRRDQKRGRRRNHRRR